MRNRERMIQNTDTTVWSGAGFMLSLVASVEQAAIAILTPAIGWVLLHYTKKLVAYLERKKGDKSNNLVTKE